MDSLLIKRILLDVLLSRHGLVLSSNLIDDITKEFMNLTQNLKAKDC